MGMNRFAAPEEEPLTLTEARQHLRPTNTEEDALILSLVSAARDHAETFTHRRFITQTWDWVMDAFPCTDRSQYRNARALELPCAPLQSVSSIKYIEPGFPYTITAQGIVAPVDADGSNGDVYWNVVTDDIYVKAAGTWGAAVRQLHQTLSPRLYQVDVKTDPGRIAPAYGQVWPQTRCETLNAVTIRFVCGYGLAAAVPKTIKQAMLLMIGHWFEHREEVSDFELFPVPSAVDMLLMPHRVLRF